MARGHRWQEQLEAGRYANIDDLAEKHGVDRSYVGRMLRLTSLAPDILKRRLKIDQSMYEILQILSMTLFEKTPINAVFQRDPPRHTEDPECKQLQLFDF